MKFPELVFLDRYDTLVPALFGCAIYGLGEILLWANPTWHTNGAQFLSWGFFLSTVVLYHATFTVNSLAHVWGSRRYATRDDSRNNPLLALITLGEGWHNNHHHYPGAVRQGFFWWEIDPTYYVLRLMATLGLVWDLRPVPERWRERDRIDLPPQKQHRDH
jgi:stearoyl-CoA desaturase (delta-9 desaturase)